MSDIPIIGEQKRPEGAVLSWYPTSLVHCKCVEAPRMSIVIVTGFGNHASCGNCGTLYANRGLFPDGKGGLNMVVDFVLPTPPGELM